MGYDIRLIALALFVCIAGSWISIRVFARARASEGSSRTGWLFLAGVPAGATIWSTHFIGLVALHPELPTAFDPTLMVLSLFVAVVAATSGFAIGSSRRFKITGEIGGAILGGGIVGMHYIGMSAFQISGRTEWNSGLLMFASLAIGPVMGAVALNRVIRPITCYCKYGAASAMVLGVCGMHVVGWAALHIVPDNSVELSGQLISSNWFSISIACVGLLVIGTGLSSYLLDDRAKTESDSKLAHLSRHDTLTGLPNRQSFIERLDLNLAVAKDQKATIAVIAMNLSRFKEINDLFGMHAGDRVLTEITRRVGKALNNGEYLARMGGDEFAIIQISENQPSDAQKLAARLAQRFELGFIVGAKPIRIGASFGIAISGEEGIDRERLLANADIALERAREGTQGNAGDNVCLFEQEVDETTRRKRALSHDLALALERNELQVFYQVQTTIASGEVNGFEALLRWKHATLGMISPVEFIPIAEETGLIIEIGEWVLRTACADAATWQHPHRIAINLSPLQLLRDDLPRTVHGILLETGLSAHRLELEITESTMMTDANRAMHILRGLKTLGVTIAVDDFGTGYSSLSTLQMFPFDKIKLDRSFLSDSKTPVQRTAVVRAVISLGKSLSMKVLTEGVETPEHLAFLTAEGCEEAQGYLLGRPVPHADIRHLVEGSEIACLPKRVNACVAEEFEARLAG